MRSTYFPLRLDHVHPFAFWNNAFSPGDCEKIISIGNSLPEQEGKTRGPSTLRTSNISWIFPSLESNWIFERITSIVDNLNDNYFKFNIYGLAEGLQFTKYQSPDGEYRMHTDRAFNTSIRKLSVSIQLSDPDTYTGGDLCIYQEETPSTLPKSQGTVIVFPSFMVHEVKKIHTGIRYSLVSWVTGEPFL